MASEKPDELGQLAAQAAGLEADSQAQADAGQGGAQEAPRQTNAELLAGTFHLMREVGCAVGGVDSPRMVLDDPTLMRLGAVWGAVADKRGWDLQRLMGDYAAEVAAIMLSIKVIGGLNKVVRAELAAREPVKAEPAATVAG